MGDTCCHSDNAKKELHPDAPVSGLEILIAGRPNSGKSTLFNRIASAQQKVGNYAGVTVEKKTALVEFGDGRYVEVSDLPGLYSLKPNSLDEEVALRAIEEAKGRALLVFVLDGNNLEQELVLPLLLKKRGYRLVIAVNMMDEVRANKKILNLAGMSELEGIPFFPVAAKSGEGVESLKKYLGRAAGVLPLLPEPASLTTLSNKEIETLYRESKKKAHELGRLNQKGENSLLLERDRKIDGILLHPVFGPVIFLLTMFVLFQSVFTWAKPLSDAIDGGFALLQDQTKAHVANAFLSSLLADGVLAGVGAVLTFVPQIAILFFLIGVLEYSGYLPRIAYLVDRLMKPYGLDGKVFIPLLSSVACAVPGIMATRTIENQRTRLMTIMIAPLMTCSARLPVYTLLIATFVPATRVLGINLQGITMFVMYVLGAVFALLVALVLHKFGFEKKGSLLDIIHLPHYRTPDWRGLFNFVFLRVKVFVRKAGTIIASMAVLLWFLLSFPKDFQAESRMKRAAEEIRADSSLSETVREERAAALEANFAARNLEQSFGGRIGKALEPVFRPIGYDWKLTVGIIASLAAREVFVATVGTVFALGPVDESSQGLMDSLKNAKKEDGTPAYTIATALSLLVFFAFSLQCISTIGVARRETNSWKIPSVMFTYMFALAYVSAFILYRIGLTLL